MKEKENRSSLLKIRDGLFLKIVGFCGSLVIRLLIGSLRITVDGEAKLEEIHAKGQKVIYTFWHGQLLILAYTLRGKNIHSIISDHRDGEMLVQVIRWLGFASVRGSTTKGGARVILNILNKLNNRYDLAITPDGPRGPRWKVQQGVIYIAQKTGLPIIPFVNGTDRFWELRSWDRFRVPKPFSKGLIIYGNPLYVPKNIDKDGFHKKVEELEEELISLSLELDRRMGIIGSE